MTVSLCAPTSEITCFGCCPPIRPHHYDPLKYASSLRREFYENRRRFLCDGPSSRPIVGYSCWALGFLDSSGQRIGCLLHPEQNNGEDLRGLIDYGRKCQRECCHPARVFSTLPLDGRNFWLPLVIGLNSFYYSSPHANILFHLLGWDVGVLEIMRSEAIRNDWTVTELLDRRRFLVSPRWNPKAHRWLFRLSLEKNPRGLSPDQIEQSCERLLQSLADSKQAPPWKAASPIAASSAPNSITSSAGTIYTHLLPMDSAFLDFLRLNLGWVKTTWEEAHSAKLHIDEMIGKM